MPLPTAPGVNVQVEIEEELYTFVPPLNGAGPTWCSGNTCIVRVGDELLASGVETVPGAKPLNNCLALLYRRSEDRWRLIYRHGGRTREPSPLACLPDGRVFLSLNPTLTRGDAHDGPSQPLVSQFRAGLDNPPAADLPWGDAQPGFTEHSYRSFAADGARGELVLVQNVEE